MNWNDVIDPAGKCPQLTDVAQFERQVGFLLPNDYKKFLLEINGGKVKAPELILDDGNTEISMAYLFPFSADPPNRGVKEGRVWQVANKISLRQSIEIGDDMGTGFFYLILAGRYFGNVFFIYKDERPLLTDEVWSSNSVVIPETMIFIASSFSGLLKLFWDGK